jgi:hypothetical protein
MAKVETHIELDKSVRVCRGVLRFWGPRIQDSRTDFGGFWRKMVGGTSMRGWCKIKAEVGNLVAT